MSGARRAVRKVSNAVRNLGGGKVGKLLDISGMPVGGLSRIASGKDLIGKDLKDVLGMGKSKVDAGAYSPGAITQQATKEQQDALARSRALVETISPYRTEAMKQEALAATGRGPSLSDLKLKSGLDRSLAQMIAASAAARGTSPALAQRAMLQAQSGAGRELVRQSAEDAFREKEAFLQRGSGLTGELQTAISALGGFGAGGDAMKMQLAQQRAQAEEAQRARKSQLFGALLGGGASILGGMATGGTGFFAPGAGAAAAPAATPLQTQTSPYDSPMRLGGFMSDKNVKKDIKKSGKDMSKFLEALDAKSYKYKDPESVGADEGDHYGIIAQALEKSKVGKSLVKDTDMGKMVDSNKAISAMLASQAELHKRLKKVEKKRG